jgi:agmatinase
MKRAERTARSRAMKIADFDPSSVAQLNNTLFGVPQFTLKEAKAIIIPAPWDPTTSRKPGTANGPAAMLEASREIELYNPIFPDAWKQGIKMLPIPEWRGRNDRHRRQALRVMRHLERGGSVHDPVIQVPLTEVNAGGEGMVWWVRKNASGLLRQDKLVGVLGGDHSVALGLMQALAERYQRFGVLHIDAHYDLYDAFHGFENSHASIIWNAAKLPMIERFVHVAVRDYPEEQQKFVDASGGRHVAFTDDDIEARLAEGVPWKVICDEAISYLPEEVYVCLDADGLDQSTFRNTGTSVVGGRSFGQVVYMLKRLIERKKRIIGFDFCEVAPESPERSTWGNDDDALNGMRLLYRLIVIALKSHAQV